MLIFGNKKYLNILKNPYPQNTQILQQLQIFFKSLFINLIFLNLSTNFKKF